MEFCPWIGVSDLGGLLHHGKSNSGGDEETYRSNTMLGIASHELRTPLGVILGYLAMMRLQYSSDVNPLLELIEKSACSLNEIVSRLLDQAHIQSGKVELRTCEVNIPEFSAEGLRPNPAVSTQKVTELFCFYKRSCSGKCGDRSSTGWANSCQSPGKCG